MLACGGAGPAAGLGVPPVSASRRVLPADFRAARRVLPLALDNQDASVVTACRAVIGCFELGLSAGRASLALVAAFDPDPEYSA